MTKILKAFLYSIIYAPLIETILLCAFIGRAAYRFGHLPINYHDTPVNMLGFETHHWLIDKVLYILPGSIVIAIIGIFMEYFLKRKILGIKVWNYFVALLFLTFIYILFLTELQTAQWLRG